MPFNAVQSIDMDYMVNNEDMANVIKKVIREKAPKEIVKPQSVIRENSIAMKIRSSIALEESLGHQVSISCATCGGPLLKIEYSKVGRYRYHVGCAFTEKSSLKSQNEAFEEIPWIAMPTFEKMKMFLQRVHKLNNQTGPMHGSKPELHQLRKFNNKSINRVKYCK